MRGEPVDLDQELFGRVDAGEGVDDRHAVVADHDASV